MSGLFISASGIINALRRFEVTANNIANLQTPGFRTARASSIPSADGGVVFGPISRDFTQGPIQFTGQPLDVATSDGFFRVELPDGSFAFTRSGNFGLNADGEVVTADGARLDPPIQVPPNATSVSVTRDGAVFASVPGEGAPTEVGRIEVFRFANPNGLEAIGGGLFRQTGASGEPQAVSTGLPLVSGAIEGSNVDLATEQVNLLLNRNLFEANLNAFRAESEVLGELLNLTR